MGEEVPERELGVAKLRLVERRGVERNEEGLYLVVTYVGASRTYSWTGRALVKKSDRFIAPGIKRTSNWS